MNMANTDNGGTGDSTISPTSEQTKQAAGYGYPGVKSGANGADIANRPAKRENGKVQP